MPGNNILPSDHAWTSGDEVNIALKHQSGASTTRTSAPFSYFLALDLDQYVIFIA